MSRQFKICFYPKWRLNTLPYKPPIPVPIAGCDDFQKVEFGSVGKVKDITVTRVLTTNQYIVTFTGVGEDIAYGIYFQPDGAKTYNDPDSTDIDAENGYIIQVKNGALDYDLNTNLDKFYALITLTKDGQNGATKGKVVVGSYSPYKADKNGAFAKSGDVEIKN